MRVLKTTGEIVDISISPELQKASRLYPNFINPDGRLSSKYENKTLDNYKIDGTNERLYNICKNWDYKESITLTGNCGTGKTHLAIALLNSFPIIELDDQETAEREKDLRFGLFQLGGKLNSLFEDTEKLKMRIEEIETLLKNELYKYRRPSVGFFPTVNIMLKLNQSAFEGNKLDALEEYTNESSRYNYDCVCFDDLGAEKLTDAKRENLYYIIDTRYRNELTTIITSNLTIEELSDHEPRLASRLAEMGKILHFTGQDYRKEILKKNLLGIK